MKLSVDQLVYSGRTGIQPCYGPSFLGDPEMAIVPGNPFTVIYGCPPDVVWAPRKPGKVPYGVIYFDPFLMAWLVAFRGTQTLAEWIANFEAWFMSCRWLNAGRIHDGMGELYDTLEAGGESLSAFIRTLPGPVIFTGHSLGAALASYAASDVGAGCTAVLWAGPRCMDDDAAALTLSRCSDVYRIVNVRDLVPKVAERIMPLFPFQHIGPAMDLDSTGQVIENIHAYHSMSTYLHLLDASQPLDPEFIPTP